MPPAKRSLPKKEEPKVVKKNGVCRCSECQNKGDEVYELIFLCKEGVNAPYGNHSILNCIKFK